MSQPYLIVGSGSPPGPYVRPRNGPSPMLKVLVLVWLIGGIVGVAWAMGLLGAKSIPSSAAPVPEATSVPRHAISVEDLLHHVEDVKTRLDNTTARLRRTEGLIGQTLPTLERNYLSLERRRLGDAVSITEAARRDLEATRQEIDLILNSLKKEHELK